MNRNTLLLAAVLVVFSVLTLQAIFSVGYLGVWRAGFADWGAMQILADLAILG